MKSDKKYSDKVEKEWERVRNLIKTARNERHLSQSQVAEKLGMTPQNYRNIELGNTTLTFPVLLEVMEILGIDSIEEKENNNPKYAVDNDLILNLFQKITDIQKDVKDIKENTISSKEVIQIGKNNNSKQLGENEHKEGA